MKVALVVEWLAAYAGSERVLEQMLACFPEADIFAVVDFVPEAERAFLQGKSPQVTFIQQLPFARSRFRHYLPLMPLAVEQHDLGAYDLILSNCHAVAKGVIVGPEQLHVSYVNSPMRYAWEFQHQYLRQAGLDRGLRTWPVRWMLHRLRLWDLRTANGVDLFLANSAFIARRIWRVYRRPAEVLYPPVDIDAFPLREAKDDFYLAASRLVPYKRLDLIVEAFAGLPDRTLVVIGDGPEMARIRRKAGANVHLLGHQPFAVLRDYLQRARAFVFAAEEDFGILPVEAQACGTPVIAYGRGGALETVRGPDQPRPSGLFFGQQSAEAIRAAIRGFEAESDRYEPVACRDNARRFSVEHFRQAYRARVDRAWADFLAHGPPGVERPPR